MKNTGKKFEINQILRVNYVEAVKTLIYPLKPQKHKKNVHLRLLLTSRR